LQFALFNFQFSILGGMRSLATRLPIVYDHFVEHMCGRFVRKRSTSELAAEFGVEEVVDEFQPSFNIAPTHDVSVIIGGAKKRLVAMRWGLVPWWATDPSMGSRLINARAETLAAKSAFKDAFKSKRCLVVADGFYEWQKRGKMKTPLLIRLKGDKPFAFAGLYDVWKSPLGPPLTTCTIVTTAPNDLLEPIHNRMPAILTKDAEVFWLDQSVEDYTRLLDLLSPYPPELMEAYEVSTIVNSVANDSPACIEPAKSPQTGLLF
jgi:putative SOS response-associated peptidase YedK